MSTSSISSKAPAKKQPTPTARKATGARGSARSATAKSRPPVTNHKSATKSKDRFESSAELNKEKHHQARMDQLRRSMFDNYGLDERTKSEAKIAGPAKNDNSQERPKAELQQQLQNKLQAFAKDNPAALGKVLEQAYPNATAEQRAQLAKRMAAGNAPMPKNLQMVEAEHLHGADGAYSAEDGGTVSLSRQLLDNPSELGRVYAEEVGHHFDSGFKKGDAPGDEGQIFQEALDAKAPIGEKRLAALRAENDSGILTQNGKTTRVENSNPEGSQKPTPADLWFKEFYEQPKGKHYDFMRSALDRVATGELKPDGPEVEAMKRVAKTDPKWVLGFTKAQSQDKNFKAFDLTADIAAHGYLQNKDEKLSDYDYPLFVSGGMRGGQENSRRLLEGALKADSPGAHWAMQDSVFQAVPHKPGQFQADFDMAERYARAGGPRAQAYLTQAQKMIDPKSSAAEELKRIANSYRNPYDDKRVRAIERDQQQLTRDQAIVTPPSPLPLYGSRLYNQPLRAPKYDPQVALAYERLQRNPESLHGSTTLRTMKQMLGGETSEQTKVMHSRLNEQRSAAEAQRVLSKEKELTADKFTRKVESASPQERKAMLDAAAGNLFRDGKPQIGNIEAMGQSAKHLDQGQIRALAQAAYATGNGSRATDLMLGGDFQSMDPQTAKNVVDWVNDNGSFEQKMKAQERFRDMPVNISSQEWKKNMTPELAAKILKDPKHWEMGDAANQMGREDGAMGRGELAKLAKSEKLPPGLAAAAAYLHSNSDAWKQLAGADGTLSRGELFGNGGADKTWHYNNKGERTDYQHWMEKGVEKEKIAPAKGDGSYIWTERTRDAAKAVTKTQKWAPVGGGQERMMDGVTKTVQGKGLPYDVDGIKWLHDTVGGGSWSPQHLLERVKGGGEMGGTQTTVTRSTYNGKSYNDSTATSDRYSKFDERGRLTEELVRDSNKVGDKEQPPRWTHRKKNGENWDSQLFIQGTTDSVTVTHPTGEANQAGDARWKMELQDSFLPKTREQIQDYNKYKSDYRKLPLPEPQQFDLTATLEKARKDDLTKALTQYGFGGLQDNPALKEFLKQQGDDAFKIAVSGSGANRSANDRSTIVLEGKDGQRFVLSQQDNTVGGVLELGDDRRMLVAGPRNNPTTHELLLDEKTRKISVYELDSKGVRGQRLSVSDDLSNARNAFNLSQGMIDIGQYPALMSTAMRMGSKAARGAGAVTAAERALVRSVKLGDVSQRVGKLKGFKGAETVLGGAMTAINTASMIESIQKGDLEAAWRTAGNLGIDAGASLTAGANWAAGGEATAGRLGMVAKIGKFAGTAGAGLGLVFGGKDLAEGLMEGDRDKIIGGSLGVAGAAGTITAIWGAGSWFGPVGWAVSALATLGALSWEGYKHTENTFIAPPKL